MAEVFPRDVLVRIGGKTLARYGTPLWRRRPADKGGEENKESFSRADAQTCATFIDRSGILRVAQAGRLRQQWYDLDGDGTYETPVLLTEPSGVQAFTFARQLDNAAWTRSNLFTVTPNVGTAPDGTLTADKIVESAANAEHFLQRPTGAVTDNTLQSWSAFAAASTRTWVFLRTLDKANVVRRSWFNTATGLWGTIDGGHTVRSWKLANGYRIACNFNASAGATAPSVGLGLATGDGVSAYLGDGASGVFGWGLQFEVDRVFPTSFVYSDAAVTRAADVLAANAYFGPQATGLTIYSKFLEAGNHLLGVGQPRVWWLGKTDLSAPFLGLQNNGGYSLRWNPGSGLVSALVAVGPVPGDTVEGIDTLQGQTITRTQSINGGAAVVGGPSVATGAIPAAFSAPTLSILLSGMTVELVDLIIARGIRTLADMQAVP